MIVCSGAVEGAAPGCTGASCGAENSVSTARNAGRQQTMPEHQCGCDGKGCGVCGVWPHAATRARQSPATGALRDTSPVVDQTLCIYGWCNRTEVRKTCNSIQTVHEVRMFDHVRCRLTQFCTSDSPTGSLKYGDGTVCVRGLQVDVRESMLQAQKQNAETKILLTRAEMELEQAAATTRTHDLRQEHTDSLQEELSKARKELQELLQDNKNDELTHTQQELSRKSLQCTREKVIFEHRSTHDELCSCELQRLTPARLCEIGRIRSKCVLQARADVAEAEVQQLMDVVPQRDALKDQVAALQHALNDMQTTTGAVDIREVLQRYQARELISEQAQEQLRTRIEQLEKQEGQLHELIGSLKARNKVRRLLQCSL